MYKQIINILSKLDSCIEFGGPTKFLGENLNGENLILYPSLNKLDGANLINDNIWFGDKFISEQKYNYFENKSGNIYNVDVADKNQLNILNKYDCIISSHQIEHLANPIKSLILWKDVLNDGGYILSFIPDKRFIFDSNRPTTTFEHLLEDFNNDIGEDDLTHIDEILSHRPDQYNEREKYYNNFKYRMAHHHCFEPDLVKEMYNFCGYDVIYNFKNDPMNIVSLVKKIK